MICFLSWFGMEKSNFQDCLNAIFIYLFDQKILYFQELRDNACMAKNIVAKQL